MKKQILLKFLCVLTLLFTNASSLFSQDTLADTEFVPTFEKGLHYNISTVYGTYYRGPVIEETKNAITILNKKTNTKIELAKYNIKEARPISASKNYTVAKFDDDYYTNFYLMTENALPFEKQGLNSTAHYFLIDNINYSFNENWGVSANIFVFLPVSIGIKCSFKISENTYFGGNVYGYGTPNGELSSFISPLFGGAARVTRGDRTENFTLGVGLMGFRITDSLQLSQRTSKYQPAYYVTFAYANRLSKHLALNIENILFPQVNLNMTGLSLKWIRDVSDHWNFGCYGLYIGKFSQLNTKSQVIPIPYISYSTFFK
jgi:hypothetical protein